jgi:hypothetical protein
VVCEEQEGHVNVYNALYYILQGSGVSPPLFLIPRGLENSRALLCTPTSANIPTITFSSLSWRLKKSGKASEKMKERTMGRTSLAVLHSRHLEMSHHQSPGVNTPRVKVLPLLSKVPPREGIACAYLSWFVFVVELNRLPGKPEGEPCVCGTIGGSIDIQLTL